jgi:hypothetical protein
MRGEVARCFGDDGRRYEHRRQDATAACGDRFCDGPRCPGCGEDRLVEFDPVTRRWDYAVCARVWCKTEGER